MLLMYCVLNDSLWLTALQPPLPSPSGIGVAFMTVLVLVMSSCQSSARSSALGTYSMCERQMERSSSGMTSMPAALHHRVTGFSRCFIRWLPLYNHAVRGTSC